MSGRWWTRSAVRRVTSKRRAGTRSSSNWTEELRLLGVQRHHLRHTLAQHPRDGGTVRAGSAVRERGVQYFGPCQCGLRPWLTRHGGKQPHHAAGHFVGLLARHLANRRAHRILAAQRALACERVVTGAKLCAQSSGKLVGVHEREMIAIGLDEAFLDRSRAR